MTPTDEETPLAAAAASPTPWAKRLGTNKTAITLAAIGLVAGAGVMYTATQTGTSTYSLGVPASTPDYACCGCISDTSAPWDTYPFKNMEPFESMSKFYKSRSWLPGDFTSPGGLTFKEAIREIKSSPCRTAKACASEARFEFSPFKEYCCDVASSSLEHPAEDYPGFYGNCAAVCSSVCP